MGSGRFVGPKTIEVTRPEGGIRVLNGKTVVISTGSRATLEHIPGLLEANPLTHIEALELDNIPEHLLVLGGGYVGLEFAQAMRRFGSRVTIVERNVRLAHREDQDVTEMLHELCRDEGIEVITSARVTSVEGKSSGVWPNRFERNGGRGGRGFLPVGKNSDDRGVAYPDAVRDARIHESAHRQQERIEYSVLRYLESEPESSSPPSKSR